MTQSLLSFEMFYDLDQGMDVKDDEKPVLRVQNTIRFKMTSDLHFSETVCGP